jgi:hypothetical protein
MGISPKARYYLLTLTDGLDNNSTTLAKIKGANKAERDSKYEAKLKKKLKKVMGRAKNPFQSYLMYYDALDSYILDENGGKRFYTEQELEDKLQIFRYGTKNTSVPSFIYVDTSNIKKLAEKFKDEFISQSFGFRISKGYLGERIKMNLKNKNEQEIILEGIFKQKGRKYYLTDIKCSDSVTFKELPSGKINMSVSNVKKGMDVLFEISSLRFKGENFGVIEDKEHNKQSIMKGVGIWEPNIEYKPETTELADAYILINLDISESFGSALSEAKSQLMKIIQIITKK